MNNTAQLIAYILAEAGPCSKEKLLALIYLFDVEYYRVHRRTFTGWDWWIEKLDDSKLGGIPLD